MKKLRAEIGDHIIITGNVNEHPYNIGDKVVVTDWYDFDSEDADVGVETSASPGEDHWFVRHTDYIVSE
jgi:hypothetical protein